MGFPLANYLGTPFFSFKVMIALLRRVIARLILYGIGGEKMWLGGVFHHFLVGFPMRLIYVNIMVSQIDILGH